eukprot:scaffold14996_cov63-Phaeocystis_antarctica.AAC.2
MTAARDRGNGRSAHRSDPAPPRRGPCPRLPARQAAGAALSRTQPPPPVAEESAATRRGLGAQGRVRRRGTAGIAAPARRPRLTWSGWHAGLAA